MINLSSSGGSITFEFSGNSGYLQDGAITCPLNSLSLILESDSATFRKSASNDIFISARYEEFGMSKAELETWYKNNAVGSTGGGGDITSGEVQTMIDESISGKADTTAVTEAITEAVSGKADIGDIPDVSNYFDGAEYDSGTTRINFYHGNTVKAYIDASQFIVDGMIDDVRIETISGTSYLVIDFNTASGKEDIQIPLTDIFNPDNYYTKNEVNAALSGKQDTFSVGSSLSLSGGVLDTKYRGYTNFVQELETTETFQVVAGFDCDAATGEANFDINDGEAFFTFEFNSLTHEYSCYDEEWVDYLQISWDNDLNVFDVTPINSDLVKASDNICVRFFDKIQDELHYVGTTTDALDGAFGEINKINSSLYNYAESSAVTEEITAAVSGKVDTSTYTAYTASTESILSGKQDTLSAGTGISISGNVISATGGSGGNNVVELTQAEYDALVSGGTVDPTAFYIITDATPIDISNYWTSAQTQYYQENKTPYQQEQVLKSVEMLYLQLVVEQHTVQEQILK